MERRASHRSICPMGIIERMMEMNTEIFDCLCRCRCLSSSISQMLDNENLSAEEKALLYDTLTDIQTAANNIQQFCTKPIEQECS